MDAGIPICRFGYELPWKQVNFCVKFLVKMNG